MKPFITILTVLCFALGMMAETQFTFTSSADMNQNKDGITVVIASGGGNAPSATIDYETKNPEMRLYLKNTITVSSSTALTNIQMVFAKSSASGKNYAGLSASIGTLVSGGVSEAKDDWKVDRWTGSATSVVFTLTGNGQRQIRLIVIDGEPVVITPPEDLLPTEDDLDANWEYAEPTAVLPQDTTIWQKEYAFINNNILVHCEHGSINKATDTTFAYFNCNAGYNITITAAQPIKGIAISGYVRKAFNATCDKGSITYLTDVDFEMEGWPALVIQDIHDKHVTLFCPKQFRCYQLEVYFKNNPEAIEMEGIPAVSDHSSPVTRKLIRDGQLIIIRGDKTYNAQGTEL